MAQKVWAVGEEVLAADFNTYVQNQVIPTFASVAERDSQWPSPPNGAMCVITTPARLNYYTRVGGQWWLGGGLGGLVNLATVTRTSDAGPQGAEAVFMTTPSITIPASGVNVRLEAYCRSIDTSGTPNGAAALRIRDGTLVTGTLRQEALVSTNASGAGSVAMMSCQISCNAGAQQWSLTLTGLAGTATLRAASTYPCYLSVFGAS